MNKKFPEGSRRLGGRPFVCLWMVASFLNLKSGSVRREFTMEELKGMIDIGSMQVC